VFVYTNQYNEFDELTIQLLTIPYNRLILVSVTVLWMKFVQKIRLEKSKKQDTVISKLHTDNQTFL